MRQLLAARRELSIRGRINEFCEMWKNSKNCINSSFWRSLGAIGIDSVSFEAFRSVSSFFDFFSILEFWLGRAHRRGFLA